MRSFSLIAVLIVTGAFCASDDANAKDKRHRVSHAERPRDCVPINGRYGYYGNPWCDTGSYRLEDLEFRQRQAAGQRSRKTIE